MVSAHCTARQAVTNGPATALITAIEMYRAMDMTFWLPQAEATLAQGSDGHGMFLLQVVGTAECHKSRAPVQHYGKRAEARKLLALIYGWFTEGLDL
jgi:hypothetical protein